VESSLIPNPFSRREKGLFAKRGANEVEDAVGMLEDVAIREPEDTESGDAKPSVAFGLVGRGRKVVSAIRFDDDKSLFTEEVDDERSKRLLTSKFRSVESTIA
jgi:hypothetical protein